MTATGSEAPLQSDEKVLKLSAAVDVQLYVYTKNQ